MSDKDLETRLIFRVVLVVLAFLLVTLPIEAQVIYATLTGNVTDSSGATVPNATVTITDTSTGVSKSTFTTTDGLYNLPYLNSRKLPRQYRVVWLQEI